jgi:hypothetical protein
MVEATIFTPSGPTVWRFDWNDRDAVRRFAADGDRAIRSGYSTELRPV